MVKMTRRSVLAAAMASTGLALAHGLEGKTMPAQPSAKPQRINKAIELLEQGQPVYYVMGTGGYKEGRAAAQTWADIIIYDMEHGGPLDFAGLQGYMKGLVDAGPTKSGHRTPAVIPQLPVGGLDEATMMSNYWMITQALDMGVHGIHLCHAREPGAIATMVQAARFPFNRIGTGVKEGLRGSGGQGHGASIWGISVQEYLRKADPWPLNPEGELLLGIKVEDKYALANTEENTAVPGIGFAEWGPGDMGMSMGYTDLKSEDTYPVEMLRARARVLKASKANHLFFLNSVNADNIESMIREGVTIGAGDEAAAEKGRRFTKRTMPW
jgi:4-hydroxy-2-oxoheptanedioate aldolase